MEEIYKLRLQKLAKEIYNLEWMSIQTDDAYEGAKLEYVMDELRVLDKEVAIRLLLDVIEEHRLPDWFFSRESNASKRGDFPLYNFNYNSYESKSIYDADNAPDL